MGNDKISSPEGQITRIWLERIRLRDMPVRCGGDQMHLPSSLSLSIIHQKGDLHAFRS